MENKEVLKKAQSKKAIIGEMEKAKIDKSNWIAVIVAGIMAVAFMIVFGAIGLRVCIWAIGAICFTWASVFYLCQYIIAKRPVGVLIGAVLEGFGACIMILNFILDLLGVI